MVQSSLVGHWPLHEWSGRANDLSGNDNHGTVNGATQGVAGKSGLTAYSFDGTDDFVDPLTIESFANGGSVSTWIKPRDVSTLQTFFGSYDNNQIKFAINSGGTIFIQLDGSSGSAFINSEPLPANKFYHAVFTYTGENVVLYLDGEQIGSDSGASGSNAFGGEDRIGCRNTGGGNDEFFDGSISDFRVYNRALSPQEIETLYEWGSRDVATPPEEEDSAAVLRYTFDDTSTGRTILDEWNDNVATLNPLPKSTLFQYDATQLNLSEGEEVTSWEDEQNNLDLTTSSGNPTYTTDGINNKGSVFFSNSSVISGSTGNIAQPFTFMLVAELVSFDTSDFNRMAIISSGNYAQNSGFWNWNSGGALNSGNPDGDIHIHEVTANGGNSEIILDATLLISGNGGTDENDLVRLEGGATMSMNVGELVIYDSDLNSAERERERNRLARKWAVPGV